MSSEDLDLEWRDLIIETREMGFTVEEVREILDQMRLQQT